MNSSVDALPYAYARGIVEGQLAGERDDGILRFIHTDHTARDMLRIVQAHGHEKIQYWGFSYVSQVALKPRAMLKLERQLWKCLRGHVRIDVSGMSFCFENFPTMLIIVCRTMSVGWLLTV
jgi:hypothetical protein